MPVPIPDGSITDFVAQVGRGTSAKEVNAAFKRAAEGALMDILEYSEAPLVSSDIVGNPASCILDSQLTMLVGQTVKVLGWYDNEWRFSNRTAELVR
jgi:glyceraldehyde 3-phosphate dehydrogenase